jgi:hypothetical protein
MPLNKLASFEEVFQYTAHYVTIHIAANSIQVTALVGDGLQVLCGKIKIKLKI